GLSVISATDHITEIIIAGMGAKLITTILEEGKEKLNFVQRLILQANNDSERIRQYFFESDFLLTDETILMDNDRIYEVLIFDKTKDKQRSLYESDIELEKQLLFGPLLLKQRSKVFCLK